MKFAISQKFKSLPFVSIDNIKVAEQLKNKPFTKIIVDVLDGDLWSSKVSFFGNIILVFLILISSLEVVLSSDSALSNYFGYFKFIYLSTSIIFAFEVCCRIIFANLINSNSTGIKGALNYIFSFYGLIDILSIIPFILDFFGFSALHFLKITRVFRVWRIVRYIPAFSSISNAFRSKKDEILVSLFGVVLLSLTLSAFIYYAEARVGSNQFKSIVDVLVWSLGKYTGDYGAIAASTPITFIGKFLATLNGVLGLALFAVPAGLLGSAFIDELTEQKQKKKIDERIVEINKYFESSYKSKASLDKRKANSRFFAFETLQSRFLYTNDEIIECVRESKNLRFRSMKSNENKKFPDVKIIESFTNNASYGCKIINESSKIFIINPVGAIERCISHFTHTIIDNLGYNYISRDVRLIDGNDDIIGGNKTKYYAEYDGNSSNNVPLEFIDFMSDISNIKKDDFVIVISSGASSRGDIILEYGNNKGMINIVEGISTIDSINVINDLCSNLSKTKTDNLGHNIIESNSLNIENHSIGNFEQDWLGKTIRRLTGANVITLYVNINNLTGEDKRYYTVLNLLLNSLESTFGNNAIK